MMIMTMMLMMRMDQVFQNWIITITTIIKIKIRDLRESQDLGPSRNLKLSGSRHSGLICITERGQSHV